ncbi:MAG: SpaH/EbpB family LPXTG-anchored major pilin [Clostridiales bacterium]|nr:SpaH/EbpB family LPXTG-anchored major pilin [Clostridiales bacterium]
MKNNIRKSAKRWLALVMTAIMVFAMGATVMAQGEATSTGYTITINSGTNNSGTTYNLYRIYDATVAASFTDGNGVSYSLTNAFSSLSAKYGDTGANVSSQLRALISDAMDIVNKGATADYSNVSANEAINVKPGYYLIVANAKAEDGGTVTSPCLVSVPGNASVTSDGSSGAYSASVAVTPKASDTNITKNITGGDSTNITATGNTSTLAIGDEIQYTITSLIPDYGDDVDTDEIVYTITDSADTTLQFVSVDSVTMSSTPETDLQNGTSGTETVDNTYYSQTVSANGFVLKFNYNELTAGQTIKITATFKLTDAAVVGEANANEAELEYTNNYYIDNGTTKITEEVNTYTFGFGIRKVDSTSGALLTGAEFEIYDSSSNLIAIIKGSGTDGKVVITVYDGTGTSADVPGKVVYTSNEVTDTGEYAIKGLEAGKYIVKETKAPSGYSIGSDLEITIVATKDPEEYEGGYTVNGNSTESATFDGVTAYSATINNTKGTIMPGTGGIGTTLFTFGGLALVILAAVLFIVYTKKQRKQA